MPPKSSEISLLADSINAVREDLRQMESRLTAKIDGMQVRISAVETAHATQRGEIKAIAAGISAAGAVIGWVLYVLGRAFLWR